MWFPNPERKQAQALLCFRCRKVRMVPKKNPAVAATTFLKEHDHGKVGIVDEDKWPAMRASGYDTLPVREWQ